MARVATISASKKINSANQTVVETSSFASTHQCSPGGTGAGTGRSRNQRERERERERADPLLPFFFFFCVHYHLPRLARAPLYYTVHNYALTSIFLLATRAKSIVCKYHPREGDRLDRGALCTRNASCRCHALHRGLLSCMPMCAEIEQGKQSEMARQIGAVMPQLGR